MAENTEIQLIEVGLLDALDYASKVEFDFDILKVEKSQADPKVSIVTMQLHDPIATVVGSQKIPDENGVMVDMVLDDVDIVKVAGEDLADAGFKVKVDPETKKVVAGRYEGSNLQFDIAKSTGEVWLVSESYASRGRAMRTENRAKRTQGLAARMGARRAGVNGA